jgi:hypothetical protein
MIDLVNSSLLVFCKLQEINFQTDVGHFTQKNHHTMDTLPLDSYFEIISFAGLSSAPSLICTCSSVYNTIMCDEYSVLLWLSQYLQKLQQEITIASSSRADEKKYLKQLRSLLRQYNEVMNRFEKRKQQQQSLEFNESYKVQAVYNMLKQFSYSCCLKSVNREVNRTIKELKYTDNIETNELIEKYSKLLKAPDQLLKFISDKKSEERVLHERKKIIYANNVSGSSLLLYFVSKYSSSLNVNDYVDDFFTIAEELINNFRVPASKWNRKLTSSIVHHVLTTNNEAIIDKTIQLYNEDLIKSTNPDKPQPENSILKHCMFVESDLNILKKVLNTVYEPNLRNICIHLLGSDIPQYNLFVHLPLEDTKELMQKFNIELSQFGLNALNSSIRLYNSTKDPDGKCKAKIDYLVDNGCARTNEDVIETNLPTFRAYQTLDYDRPIIMKQLLEGGASLFKTIVNTEISSFPIPDVIRLLIEYGAPIHENSIQRAFQMLGYYESERSERLFQTAEYLLENGADPHKFVFDENEYYQYLSCIRYIQENSTSEIIERGMKLLEKYGVTKEKDVDPNGMDFETFVKNHLFKTNMDY